MTSTMPQELVDELREMPERCDVRDYNVTPPAETRCPNEAAWVATDYCANGHQETALVCTLHKAMTDAGVTRFACAACGADQGIPTQWRRL